MTSGGETDGLVPGQTFETEIESAPSTPLSRVHSEDMTSLTTEQTEERRLATEKALSNMRDDVVVTGIGCCHTNKHKERVWFIHPDGQFRKKWDMFQSMLLIYVALSVPYRLGLAVETVVLTGDWWWELFVDLYFDTDVVLNFRTGSYDSDGALIHDRKVIRDRYLRGWFSIDCVSCFPAVYIAQIVAAINGEGGSGGKIGNMKGIRILRLLRLAKMLRLGRLKRIFVRYAEELQPVIKLIKLLGMVTAGGFTAHILACMWYYVGIGYDDVLADGTVQSGWIRSYHDCDEVQELTGCTGRWGVNLTAGERPTAGDAYLVSFYWAVTTLTTIGYGDISPLTVAEKYLGIFAMAVGSFFFGMLVGSLSAAITSGNLANQEHRKRMEQIREFMRTHDVPTKTRRRVIAYVDNYYLNKTAFIEEEFLGPPGRRVLPAAMDRELKNAMYNAFIKSLPFVRGLDYEVQMAVVEQMRPIDFAQGDAVTTEGETGLDMFVVVSGTVKVMKDGNVVKNPDGAPILLNEGAVFGEEPLLHIGLGPDGTLRPETHIASSALELKTVSNGDMITLMETHPDLAQCVVKYVVEREKEKRQLGGKHSMTSTTSISMTQLEKLAEKKVTKTRRVSVANIMENNAKHTAPTDSNTLREATDDEDIAGLVSDDPILPPPASPVSRSNSALLDSGLVQQLMDDQAKQAASIARMESMLNQLLNK